MFRYLVATALGVSLYGSTSAADGVIKSVQDRYNGAHTLSVRFVEDFDFQGRHRPSEAGVLTLRKQGKMRWDYTQPAGKLFISDGKTIYLYTAEDNRVEKIPIRDTEDMRAPLAFLLGHLELKKEFKDFAVRPDKEGTWLDASAKTERVPYQSVSMLVRDGGTIERLKVLGRDGASMTFAFANERVNPPVPENAFRFAIPPGAEVIDAVEFSGEGK